MVVAGEQRGRLPRARPGPTYGDHRAIRRHFLDPASELAERDVPGPGCVPGTPFGRLPNVEQLPPPATRAAASSGPMDVYGFPKTFFSVPPRFTRVRSVTTARPLRVHPSVPPS